MVSLLHGKRRRRWLISLRSILLASLMSERVSGWVSLCACVCMFNPILTHGTQRGAISISSMLIRRGHVFHHSGLFVVVFLERWNRFSGNYHLCELWLVVECVAGAAEIIGVSVCVYILCVPFYAIEIVFYFVLRAAVQRVLSLSNPNLQANTLLPSKRFDLFIIAPATHL